MPYLGFHYEADIGGKTIGFAVMPRCTISGSSPLDTLTETASHEYFEWATDPFPFSDPAWSGVDDDHIMWEKLFLGELGDLCVLKGLRAATEGMGFMLVTKTDRTNVNVWPALVVNAR